MKMLVIQLFRKADTLLLIHCQYILLNIHLTTLHPIRLAALIAPHPLSPRHTQPILLVQITFNRRLHKIVEVEVGVRDRLLIHQELEGQINLLHEDLREIHFEFEDAVVEDGRDCVLRVVHEVVGVHLVIFLESRGRVAAGDVDGWWEIKLWGLS